MPRKEFEDRHKQATANRNHMAFELYTLRERCDELKTQIKVYDSLLVADDAARQDWDAQTAIDTAEAAKEVKKDA